MLPHLWNQQPATQKMSEILMSKPSFSHPHNYKLKICSKLPCRQRRTVRTDIVFEEVDNRVSFQTPNPKEVARVMMVSQHFDGNRRYKPRSKLVANRDARFLLESVNNNQT